MKRIATLLAFLATSATVLMAQNLSVKGTVYDFDTAEPLSPAAVQIFQISGTDSTYINGTSTDDDGAFVISNLSAGNYVARVSFLGYDNADKNFSLRSGSAVTDLGKITMRGGQMLEEVAINAVVAKVQIINDTVMFNSAAYKLPEGSSVEDLIRKLPGVQIGSDGNITVNGKSVSRILVNGKEFFNDDKTVALTQLTADMIEKVKAYEKQSDLARQTGIDDGEEETVLDLQVKKGMAKGWFGNLSVGGGAPLEKEGFDVAALYQVNASLNRFDEDKQFTIMGSASQSSGGMGGMGGMRMGGGVGMGMGGFGMGGGFGGMTGGGGGVSKSYSGGANFAMNLGKEISSDNYQYEVGGSVNWSHSDNTSSSKSSGENFYATNAATPGAVDHTWNNRIGDNGSGSNSLSANMRIEWNKDTYTSLLFQPQFSWSTSSSTSTSKSRTFKDDPYKFMKDPLDTTSFYTSQAEIPSKYGDFIASINIDPASADPEGDLIDSLISMYNESIWNIQNSNSKNTSKSTSASGTAQFVRRFGNRGRNISLRGTYNISNQNSDQFSRSEQMSHNYAFDPTTMTRSYVRHDTLLNRYNDNPSKRQTYSIQATYSEPIATGTYLQFSYQFQYSAQNSDRATYNMSDALADTWGNPDWIYEDNQLTRDEKLSTNSFYYNYDQTAQIQFRKNATDQTYNFTVGLSVLPQYSKMNYTGMGVTDTLLERTVFNWTPTVQFRYRVTRQEQINIRYNGRSSQPQMSQLLDIRDDTDPFRVSSGNPDLLPTFNNQLSLGYQKYNPVTMGSFNINTSVSNTLRQIQNKTTLLANGGTESKPINMDGFWSNWNANASIMYNYTFPDDRYSIMTNTSGNYQHQESWAQIMGGDAQLRKSNTTGANESLSAEYRDDYLTISLDGSLRYSHSTNDLQPERNMDTYDFSYGTSLMAYIPWRNMRVGSDLNMNSRRGYDEGMNTNELIWNASLSFSFLKGNKASLSLAAYDILHQRSTVNRSMSATSRTDTENKNITSYFMATLTYRLSLMGDRNSRQQLRGRGGMGGFGGGMGGFGGGMGGFGGGMGGFGGGMGGFGGGMF
ncbi:MAG: outer membrane beta-barrel protein [Bacteroidaceae bacterium]|nr:outer membrane beta-barrel protein [Bacteroidaceae bacterium]